MKPIHTPAASEPKGHYSQGMLAGKHLYISAQLPLRDGTEEPLPSIEWQTQSVMSAILAITKAAGGDIQSIARVSFYVKDLADWGRVNDTFARFMGTHKPARGVFNVAALKDGWLVSADAIAVIG